MMRLAPPMAPLVAPTTVQLPKQSEVGMIVLYGEHWVEFKVLAKVGEEWKELQRFRNNRRKRIAVTTPVVTDMIRIAAMKVFLPPKNYAQGSRKFRSIPNPERLNWYSSNSNLKINGYCQEQIGIFLSSNCYLRFNLSV